MRKKLFHFIISTLLFNISFGQVIPVDKSIRSLRHFSKTYFRSDPLFGSFSGFLTHLINDPDIDSKTIRKRTDTSFYYFSGIYKKNNPFSFIPKRIEVILNETSIQYDDSLQTRDTLFFYQLVAYTGDDDKSVKEIKREFEKIYRQNNRKFYSNSYLEDKKENEIIATAYHYFVSTNWIAPLTVAWGKIESRHETALNITLRIKMDANQTSLPGPFLINLPEKIIEALSDNSMQ